MTEHDTNVRPLLLGNRVAGVTVSLKGDANEGLGGRTVCQRVLATEESAAESASLRAAQPAQSADVRRTGERRAAA